MFKDEVMSVINVDDKTHEVTCKDFTDKPGFTAFGKCKPSMDVLYKLFRWRMPEEGRPDIKELLAYHGLQQYDPLEWCKKTHGILGCDFFWLRFDDEKCTYEEAYNKES